MSWHYITVGDHGFDARLRLVKEGVAENISSYTERRIILRKPDGTLVTNTASFATDGADGVITFTVPEGTFNVAGAWAVRGRIMKSDVQITSEWHEFEVEA